jgi:hypothetical protein
MTEKILSPLGFELHTGSVDPDVPSLFRICLFTGDSLTKIIYVGKSEDGAQKVRPARNGKTFRQIHRDLDEALRSENRIVFELVENMDIAATSIFAAKRALQRKYGLSR